jgi:hypothetical protein
MFIALSSILTYGQEQKSIEDSYVDYFSLPRESLFLHTNKTTYLIGEEIWFKVYTYDRRSHLSSKATTNIYLGIYDEDGKQIDKKLFLAKEGLATGNLEIDSTFVTGNYYLKTATNWMKNFKEDDSYVQKIRIINPNSKEISSKKISSKEYDIQFLPEGGYLLEGVKNTVGVKAIDDKGKGTTSNGTILNSANEEVASFKSNLLGLGKFSFMPVRGESYTAKIILENGKEVSQKIQKAEKTGIALTVNNVKENKVIINLSTNENSLKLFKEKNFKLFVHKDGEGKSIPFVFNNNAERVTIDKAGLFKGVNTVTLFNDKNQPILERMFFNDFSIENNAITVRKKAVVGDSISYELSSKLKYNHILNASISVLPKGTSSYSPKHNIISALYLQPYIKGAIENPQYYFSRIDRKKKYELDILLLTQGWSRYSWDDIFNFPPKPNFDFENGVTINGGLNNDLDNVKSLLLYPSTLNKSMFIPFDEKGRFNIKNYYPIVGEDIKFSYTDKKQRTKKPGMAISFIKFMNQDDVNTDSYQDFTSFYANKNGIPTGFLSKNAEELDEVVVSTKLDRKKRKRYILPFTGSLINIGKNEVMRYTNLSDFLNFNGFNVIDDAIQARITPQRRATGTPIFFLDNIRILDPITVVGRSMTDFEDVFIDANPSGYNRSLNSGGSGGGFVSVIKLYSRRTPISRIDRSKSFQSFIKTNYGFQPKKEFYTPKYISYNIKPFKDYGVIHWTPSVTVQNNGPSIVKTINTGLSEVVFYIEGISSNGDLISQKVTFNNKSIE